MSQWAGRTQWLQAVSHMSPRSTHSVRQRPLMIPAACLRTCDTRCGSLDTLKFFGIGGPGLPHSCVLPSPNFVSRSASLASPCGTTADQSPTSSAVRGAAVLAVLHVLQSAAWARESELCLVPPIGCQRERHCPCPRQMLWTYRRTWPGSATYFVNFTNRQRDQVKIYKCPCQAMS